MPRVLLVAPDPELAALVREALEPEGLVVHWARGAEAAAVRVLESAPALAIVDVEHCSLADLGAALGRGGAPGTPVLLLAGPRPPTLAGRVRLVGSVQKPFALTELQRAVVRSLAHAAAD
jgi:DNA-binding response OmpR family regulator